MNDIAEKRNRNNQYEVLLLKLEDDGGRPKVKKQGGWTIFWRSIIEHNEDVLDKGSVFMCQDIVYDTHQNDEKYLLRILRIIDMHIILATHRTLCIQPDGNIEAALALSWNLPQAASLNMILGWWHQ